MSKISQYFKDVIAELKKVTWLEKSKAIKMTLIVVLSTAAISALVGLIDYGFTKLISFILNK